MRDYSINKLGEKGIPVEQGFEYNSGNNTQWLTQTQLMDMIKA